jgi:hypothetical protein
MDKRIISLVIAASLTGQAHAFPVEAIASFFSKLSRGWAKEGAWHKAKYYSNFLGDQEKVVDKN